MRYPNRGMLMLYLLGITIVCLVTHHPRMHGHVNMLIYVDYFELPAYDEAEPLGESESSNIKSGWLLVVLPNSPKALDTSSLTAPFELAR